MARARNRLSLVYVISIGAHLVVGGALALIPQEKLREVVGIAFTEAPKPKPAAPKEEPRPNKPSTPRPTRATAPAAPAPAQPTEPTRNNDTPAFASLGISLDSSSQDGLAVPVAARPEPPKALAVVAPRAPRVLVAERQLCNEEIRKAIPDKIVRPDYTSEARRADVEGRVRLELRIDERGAVTDVRVLGGLGHGLDEQAMLAARKTQFRPATRCGKPVESTFVLAMRFALSS